MITSDEDSISPSRPSPLAGAVAPSRETRPAPDDAGAAITRWEAIAAGALFALMLVTRVVAARRYRIDSDETQHMHVVWGWTHGLLQYREIFDNHAPLFQLLMAPFMAILPEQPMTLIWLRMAMIPFFAVALWAVYLLGNSLFSRRAGVWAAVFTGFMPGFFLCSTEFRTDNLWTDFWLLALAVILGGKLSARRSFFAGLLFGAALSTSMKTAFLLLCLAGGGVFVGIYQLLGGARLHLTAGLANLGAALAGFLIVPGTIIAYFAHRQALHEMYYGVIQHNLVLQRSATGLDVWFLPICAGLAIPCWFYFYSAPKENRGRRTLLLLTALIYLTFLFTRMPLIEREHFLPFFPLLCLLLTSHVLAAADWLGFAAGRRYPKLAAASFVLPLAIALWEARACSNVGRLGSDRTKGDLALVRAVLELTTPSQTVIDKKGETVFRPRTFFYVLEPIVRTRIRMGTIKDDTIARAIKTQTRVAIGDIRSKDISEKTRAFLTDNYLNTGVVRVLGKRLPEAKQGDATFQILVPEMYAVVNFTDGQPIADGTLDGAPYTGPRMLAPGEHHFRAASASPQPDAAVMLADAVALWVTNHSP